MTSFLISPVTEKTSFVYVKRTHSLHTFRSSFVFCHSIRCYLDNNRLGNRVQGIYLLETYNKYPGTRIVRPIFGRKTARVLQTAANPFAENSWFSIHRPQMFSSILKHFPNDNNAALRYKGKREKSHFFKSCMQFTLKKGTRDVIIDVTCLFERTRVTKKKTINTFVNRRGRSK